MFNSLEWWLALFVMGAPLIVGLLVIIWIVFFSVWKKRK